MAESSTKIVTYDELKAHTRKDDLYVLLHGKVYQLSKFIDEHPGGDEVILAEAGKDATEAFEDVGHSDEARGLLEDMYVGEFEKDGPLKAKIYQGVGGAQANTAPPQSVSNTVYLFPLSILAAYFAYKYYFA